MRGCEINVLYLSPNFSSSLFFSTDNVFQQPLHLVIRIRAAHQTQDHKAVLWVQVWVTQIQTIRWVRATRPNKQNNYQKQIYTLEVYNRERLIKIYTICVHSKCLHHFGFLSSIDKPLFTFPCALFWNPNYPLNAYNTRVIKGFGKVKRIKNTAKGWKISMQTGKLVLLQKKRMLMLVIYN